MVLMVAVAQTGQCLLSKLVMGLVRDVFTIHRSGFRRSRRRGDAGYKNAQNIQIAIIFVSFPSVYHFTHPPPPEGACLDLIHF